MPALLRVALIGAGRMGSNHARVLSAIPGVELAGILDRSRERATALAATFSCPVLGSLDEARHADAAIVAVSSAAHSDVGVALLADGVPCLVEKPLALTPKEGRDLIDAAARGGVALAVGHVERFNPAVSAAVELLADERILAIEGRRLNPGSARIQDSDVVIDLMVHDIDTVLLLVGSVPDSVLALGSSLHPGTHLADHASAMLSFADGTTACLTASRLSQIRSRRLTILCPTRTVELDYVAQTVAVTAQGTDAANGLAIAKAQPLERELGTFINAVRAERLDAGVGGLEALRTLEVAWAVQRALAGDRAEPARE